MTDSDPLFDLAAQLEELSAQLEVWRGQWGRTQGEIGVLRERLERETGQTIMLRVEVKRLLAEVKGLAEQLERALEKRQLTPPAAPWWCVTEAEGRSMLAELRHWVEDFARKHYPAYLARNWTATRNVAWSTAMRVTATTCATLRRATWLPP